MTNLQNNLNLDDVQKKTLKILDDLENGKISTKQVSKLATQLDTLLEQSENDIKKDIQS